LIPKVSLELEKQFYGRRWASAASALSPEEKERLALTVSSIPQDARSILDLGCGDGRLSNLLRSVREGFLASLDLSLPALRRLTTPGCCGSAERLPFRDHAFDLILAAEMMEHLPEAIYASALQEMARVAGKYILITVPNRENLEENTAVCPDCGVRFHVWGHQRAYAPRDLTNLFRGFRRVRHQAFGAPTDSYNRCLLWIRTRWAGACCWEDQTVCYACGCAGPPQPRSPFLTRACDYLNHRCWKPLFPRKSWLLALFEREYASDRAD
jgi:SAM-dependent methyltransferase